MFQLTRPRGTRQDAGVYRADARVSTHASAGDATPRIEEIRRAHAGFNSRVRGGRDQGRRRLQETFGRFNSRVRGGRDPKNLTR